jgi:hypothetical protein
LKSAEIEASKLKEESKGGAKESDLREEGRKVADSSHFPAGLPDPSCKCHGDDDMSKEFNATKQVDITIRNKLIKEKRDVNVYHHFNKSAHIVSCNSSLRRGIKTGDENDYLHISVASGPGHLKNHCVLDIPSFLDFKFSLNGEEITLVHAGKRMLLRVPPGPPVWQLKMTIPTQLFDIDLLSNEQVIVKDADEWPDSLNGEM